MTSQFSLDYQYAVTTGEVIVASLVLVIVGIYIGWLLSRIK